MSAAAIVGFFTILSQIGGFAKELTVAAWFGTGDALDAFLIALLVPTFIVNILAGALSASFLPTFILFPEFHIYFFEIQGLSLFKIEFFCYFFICIN